jgi:hypothetical protein
VTVWKNREVEVENGMHWCGAAVNNVSCAQGCQLGKGGRGKWFDSSNQGNEPSTCQGLLGQCAMASVAILGKLATLNLQLADLIIRETERIPPLRSFVLLELHAHADGNRLFKRGARLNCPLIRQPRFTVTIT